MKIYIGLYTGEESKTILLRSPTTLGNRPDVYLIDMVFDDSCLDLKKNLEEAGMRCTIKAGEGWGFNETMNLVFRICIETELEYHREGIIDMEYYLEVGNLDNMLSGAMFTVANRNGGRIVSYDDFSYSLKTIEFKPLPDVSRMGYYSWKALDSLFNDGSMDRQ